MVRFWLIPAFGLALLVFAPFVSAQQLPAGYSALGQSVANSPVSNCFVGAQTNYQVSNYQKTPDYENFCKGFSGTYAECLRELYKKGSAGKSP